MCRMEKKENDIFSGYNTQIIHAKLHVDSISSASVHICKQCIELISSQIKEANITRMITNKGKD